jgi:hypothetical protein
MEQFTGYCSLYCLNTVPWMFPSRHLDCQVRKYMVLAASDLRFDNPVAAACYNDRQSFCSNVPDVREVLKHKLFVFCLRSFLLFIAGHHTCESS